MAERPDFDEYFFQVANAVALRGDCRRRQVGAIIVWGNRVWATGYNGPPTGGQPGCLDGACPRGLKSKEEIPPYSDYSNCIAVHAEVNALRQFHFIREYAEPLVVWSWGLGPLDPIPPPAIFVTAPPCTDCAIALKEQNVVAKWIPE
jgi:deoxycytidylate deaminase